MWLYIIFGHTRDTHCICMYHWVTQRSRLTQVASGPLCTTANVLSSQHKLRTTNLSSLINLHTHISSASDNCVTLTFNHLTSGSMHTEILLYNILRTEFGVDSFSRFPFTVRKHTHTNRPIETQSHWWHWSVAITWDPNPLIPPVVVWGSGSVTQLHFDLWPCLLKFDLYLQSQESYGHDPCIQKRSRSKVTPFKSQSENSGWTNIGDCITSLLKSVTTLECLCPAFRKLY